MRNVIITTAVGGMLLFGACFPYITADSITAKVTHKERIMSSGSSKYLIFTENEVFENTDCFVRFKFDSSDLYNKIKLNEKYIFDVYGWRVPFLSMYRNIVGINNKTIKEN